ncbi:hypothetical protein [Rahnella inusitata]|uniref:gp53-like domain-containing protein n=1 Tax=Rahnella inusitata TaxID=58169 RepID=UPI0039BDCA13
MNRADAPAKQAVPFGVNGQREALLPTTPAGDNTASYDAGFPPVTMILKAAGGLPPKGQDMNQILYELSALARWLSAGAINSYDATFSTAIGGYPKGAVVIGTDGITRYISTVDSNVTNPNASGAGWFNISSGYLQTLNNLSEIQAAGTAAQASARTNLALGNSATLNTGTTAGTVATGNDSRITGSLQKGSNLADVQSTASSRDNLGLGNAATKNVGTVAGTLAAADDARIVGALQKGSNLADVQSTASSRDNLGLGNAATKNVGTVAGTLAAADDARIVGALQKGSNLADVQSTASSRDNLGLGNAATKNVGTVAGTLAAADDARIVGALQKGSNLADLPSISSSRTNLGLGSVATLNSGTGAGNVPTMSSFTSGVSGSSNWQYLPSGMLMQYGYIDTMSAGLSTVVYPIPFPSGLRSLTLTPTGTLGAASVNAVIPSLTPAAGTALTAFSASGYNIPAAGGAPVAANILFYWEAIGS